MKCPDCARPVAGGPGTEASGWIRPAALIAAGAALIAASAVLIIAGRHTSPTAPAPRPVGHWKTLAPLSGIRGATTAVLKRDGSVLAVGGGIGSIPLAATESFDPPTRHWTRSGDLREARRGNATVVLADGRILTAGGVAGSRALASAEIYQPADGTWSTTGAMLQPRLNHTLTVLSDGRVLAAGGSAGGDDPPLSSADLYDPHTGIWTPVSGGLLTARASAAAVLLKDGRVLIAGGSAPRGPNPAGALDSAELFDPAGAVFTRTDSLRQARRGLTLTLLGDGRALATGGHGAGDSLVTAEVYDPILGRWSTTAPMHDARDLHAAGALPSGQVLVTGGELIEGGTRTSLTSAELFDPASGRWSQAAAMSCPRSGQAQVTLGDGQVVVIAGDAAFPGDPPRAQSCTEIFDPR